jgi:hypothetical protein
MTETAIPEDIREKATRFAGEYLAHDVSCERLYRDVVALLMAERERAAEIVQPFTMKGGPGGAFVRKAAWSALDAIRNQP